MILPKKLTKGDTISIIAPSNPITGDRKFLLDNAIHKLEDAGFKTICASHCGKTDRFGVSGGEPHERADDLNKMFGDPTINAIWCAHGGSTANQILPYIDWKIIRNNPKIFLGMSDIDVLHMAINKMTGLITFHGSDPKSGRGLDLDLDYTWDCFKERLVGKQKHIVASSSRKTIRKGRAEGRIIGCNLSSILKLAGTEYFPDFTDAILFLEGYKDDMRHTICKLQQLEQIGVFKKIKGMVIGYVVGFQDEELKEELQITSSFEDIILDITKSSTFPIIKTNDFGHCSPNCFLPIGAPARIDTDRSNIDITDHFLE
ncbi:MAG: S66 peptidase family protein [Nanoarchaeota archaeon]